MLPTTTHRFPTRRHDSASAYAQRTPGRSSQRPALSFDDPGDSPLAVGDMVAFGISHPCLTFDKWRLIHLVDDDYRVMSSIRTYF
jgi:D-serine deaminase-like pyridoxal phosphate-dependent protein